MKLLQTMFFAACFASGGGATGFLFRHATYTLGFQDGYDTGYVKGLDAAPVAGCGIPIDWSKVDTSKLKMRGTGGE